MWRQSWTAASSLRVSRAGLAVIFGLISLTSAMGAGLDVVFEKRGDWGSAFIGEFRLTNRGESEVKNWKLEFDLDAEITSVWGAEVSDLSAGGFRFVPMDWSQQIRPNQTVTIGFIAEPGDSAGPTSISFEPVIAGEAPVGGGRDSSEPTVNIKPVYGGATDTQAAIGAVEIDFRVVSDWISGYQAEVTLTNRSAKPVKSWELSFRIPGYVTRMWNARFAGIADGRIRVDAASENWNAVIPPGGAVRFGFVAAPGGVVGAPADWVFRDTTGSADAVQVEESGLVSRQSEATPAPAIVPATRTEYVDALRASLFFYDAQRSGRLPEGFRVEWRGDSGLADGSDLGLDLTGGFYDAGDGIKFLLPMASAMTLLAWGGLEFSSGYERAGELDRLHDLVRWGADWLMRAHFGREELAVQVGQGELDHAFWGPPEKMTMPRPTFIVDRDSPGSDAAAEASAALSSASLLLRDVDPEFSKRCLQHARELFDFADQYRGNYSDSVPEARAYYPSTGYLDELAWAAAWLAKASDQVAMLARAEAIYHDSLRAGDWQWTHSWDDKRYGLVVLLAQMTGEAEYVDAAARWLDWWAGGGVRRSPGGLAWLDQWGSLRYSANTAFLALMTARLSDGRRSETFRKFAQGQIDYMLGNHAGGRSFVVGVGRNAPRNPHHRAAHGSTSGRIDDPADNRNVLFGALVGGPSAPRDEAYSDDRSNYLTNEVALDYNAGFTGALAGLIEAMGQ